MRSLARSISPGLGSYFEAIEAVLTSAPIPLKFPFAVLGLSLEPPQVRHIAALTTELDEFLMRHSGYVLDELLAIHEMPHYDFKEQSPAAQRCRDTVCAFANLPNGGMLIIGVADDGSIPGLAKGKEVDGVKQHITTVISDAKFLLKPKFTFHVFDAPNNPSRSILVVRVEESELKPCMLDGKVYVRLGPTTRQATPEDVRRIILG